MAANTGVLRRTYDYVAMFALLHVLAAIGVGTYLLGSGAITREKLQDIVAVLRGKQIDADDTAGEKVDDSAVMDSPEPGSTEDPEHVAMESELLRLEAKRIKAELDQRLTLNNSIMLRVTAQKDDFEREQERAQKEAQASMQRRQEEGARKQIAIFEALSPKVAVEHLLNLGSPDEAARVLLEMNTRKAKKIVEAAKSGDQLKRMETILQRLRDVAPDRSEDFKAEEGTP